MSAFSSWLFSVLCTQSAVKLRATALARRLHWHGGCTGTEAALARRLHWHGGCTGTEAALHGGCTGTEAALARRLHWHGVCTESETTLGRTFRKAPESGACVSNLPDLTLSPLSFIPSPPLSSQGQGLQQTTRDCSRLQQTVTDYHRR